MTFTQVLRIDSLLEVLDASFIIPLISHSICANPVHYPIVAHSVARNGDPPQIKVEAKNHGFLCKTGQTKKISMKPTQYSSIVAALAGSLNFWFQQIYMRGIV
jgi:hypothetical protein